MSKYWLALQLILHFPLDKFLQEQSQYFLCSSKTMYAKQLQELNSPFQFFTIFMFLSIYLLLIIPNATSLSFNYTSFLPSNDDNITYERDASPPSNSDRVIRLTKDREGQSRIASCGRVKYGQEMQLWEKSSGKLTDFTTHFSFIIDSHGNSSYGDGFAFFLAPNGSLLDNHSTDGGSMCLTLDQQQLNSSANRFVAVEFDVFANTGFGGNWDLIPSEHVGVDIGSMKSVANVTWEAKDNIMNGKLNKAQISYNSSSLNLSVAFTGSKDNTTIEQNLHYIVDLRDYLPEKVIFGFSAATGYYFASYEIHSWDFNSTLEIPEKAQGPVAQEPVAALAVPGSPTNAKVGLAVGLSFGGFVLILVLGFISFGLWKRWKKNNQEEGSDEYMEDLSGGTGPKKYSYAELASATNNFKDEHKLGQGGFGSVYKGFLKDMNSYVAIKRVSEDSRQGIKEFTSEVKIISRLRHRNLVQLIGWCHEKKQLLLVYEYMPNGSLDFHLFRDQNLLTWEMRYKIAQGLASALLYLHEECEQCVVHRDIKSNNILLGLNCNTKLGDFGLARLVDHEKGSRTTNMAGTLGYMAPECVTIGRATKESDIYSFGAVALEIACGRKSINSNAPENEISLVEWVWELYGNGRILEAADPRLSGNFEQQQMICLMIIGLWCAHTDHHSRPSIRQAIQVLNFEAPLPNLPPSLPVLTYIEYPWKASAAQCGTYASVAGHDQNISSSLTSNTNSSGITVSL